MKINKLFFLLSILFPISLLSQVQLTGVVKNSIEPIEFSNVVLTDTQNNIVSGTITDSNGNFNLTINKGKYRLNISFLGFVNWSKEISLTENFDFGNIILKEDDNALAEVVIIAKKPLIEQKVDRLVFNVENSIFSSAGDALDALKVTPGILVQNDQIAMIGKSGMAVMVEDRIIQLSGDDLINYLKSISADDIKVIEVITTPPAKYEAEGNSGLINIMYKKGRNNAWSNSIRTAYTQTTYPGLTVGNSFNYSKNKFRLFASIDGKKGSEAVIEKSYIYYPNQTWMDKTDRKDRKDYISSKIAIDYDLTKKSSIGLQYLGNYGNPDIKDKNMTNIFNNDNSLNSYIISFGNNDKRKNNHSFNLHFLHSLDSLGANFSIDLDYFTYEESQDRPFSSETILANGNSIDFLSAINKSNQKIDNYSAKIDIVQPTNWANLSYGGKITFINTNSLLNYFDTTTSDSILDSLQSDIFEYEENTQALYFDLGKKFNEKWQAKLGLRLENTQTKGESFTYKQSDKNNYTKLFPTFYLLHNINENNSINLNYSRRIQRPAYWELNPFRWYINANSYAEGNPFLSPSETDNIELSYNNRNKFLTNVFFTKTLNGFGQVPIIEPNLQIYKKLNYFEQRKYGVSESYTYNKYNWWTSYNQVYLYYSDTNVDDENNLNIIKQNGLGFYFTTNNTFNLNKNKTVIFNLNSWYNAPNKSLIYKENESFSLNLGLKLLFLRKKLNFNLTIYDIFKTSTPDFSSITSNINQTSNFYNDNRYLIISLKYSFGNTKIYVNERNFGNEEEKRRVN